MTTLDLIAGWMLIASMGIGFKALRMMADELEMKTVSYAWYDPRGWIDMNLFSIK